MRNILTQLYRNVFLIAVQTHRRLAFNRITQREVTHKEQTLP